MEQLSHKYPHVKFLKVDVDRCGDISGTYRVTAMPTFLLFKGASVVDTLRGADPVGLEDKINKHKVDPVPSPVGGSYNHDHSHSHDHHGSGCCGEDHSGKSTVSDEEVSIVSCIFPVTH